MIFFLAGGLLVAIGILELLIAPLAQSCVVSSDMTVCETIGTIVLNVSGLISLVGGMAVLSAQTVRSRRHKISA